VPGFGNVAMNESGTWPLKMSTVPAVCTGVVQRLSL
jgi:hypothetical protein